MGRRGPAKTATVIQLMRGDPGKRAKRQFRKEMKAPQTKALKCPRWLSREGRAVWRRVVKVFGEMEAEGQRLLTDLDVDTLGAYCQAVADLAMPRNVLLTRSRGICGMVTFRSGTMPEHKGLK